MSFRQPNQQFMTFSWPANFSSNMPLNQWPVPLNFPYYYNHPLTHNPIASPPQNPFDFPAQNQATSVLVPQNITPSEHILKHTDPAPPENEPSAANSPISNCITNIKDWVIVDLEENGTFRIAGHHLESGHFLSSGKIVFINNHGNLMSDGQQTFILHGPISWRLYEVHFPGVKINPNPQLKQAFNDGFPKVDRKRWISKLSAFLKQLPAKPYTSQNVLYGHRSLSPSLIQRKSDDNHERFRDNDMSYFDDNEAIPSITMLEEENPQQFDCEASSSDESEQFRAKSRRCRIRQRLRPKLVDVGVQTLPQRPPERPKMYSRSTSTRRDRQASPITDWMRSGCRLDRVLQEVYAEDSTQYGSIESPLVTDETGPSSSSRLANRQSSREVSKTSPNSKPFHRHAPRKSLKLLHSTNTEEISLKKKKNLSPSRSAATTSSHSKSKPTSSLHLSNSSSSVSNISSAYLKEVFPKQYNQLEFAKDLKTISKLDDKHTLITQNVIHRLLTDSVMKRASDLKNLQVNAEANTACNQGIVDVRALRRTRSGRLSVPTRDTWHRQKIVCNGNDISVSHGEFGKYFSSRIDE